MNPFRDPQLVDWNIPPQVRAMVTTRAGGVSAQPYASLNLGAHVGDRPENVRLNRARVRALLPSEPVWLDQVHGTNVVDAHAAGDAPQADGAVTRVPGIVCAVLTADCLPVLLCDRAGTVVGAAHAGWRGLAAGVLESALARMRVAPAEVMAWLGPAIGPSAFEVGDEVRARFVARDSRCACAFVPGKQAGKWMADLFLLARLRLQSAGVSAIAGGGVCTFDDSERFYSYRRDGVTGRFVSTVWLQG